VEATSPEQCVEDVEAAFYASLEPPFAHPSSHGLPTDQEDLVWAAIDSYGEAGLVRSEEQLQRKTVRDVVVPGCQELYR
jgi:hypothetical protein